MKDINVEDIADLTDATDNVRVFCPVHDVYYECAGVPTQVSCDWSRERTLKVRNHGEGPWLKAATTAFTFKTLLRHYAKRALTQW